MTKQVLHQFTTDIVIGLEVHAQLNTNTKLFCGCATSSASGKEEPNTRTCEVCLGHPGSKPVLNKRALEFGMRLCLALDCYIAPTILFSRKSYFYPDMAKNYQITQYEVPLGNSGKLRLSSGKEVGIERVHIEEDPAALVHPAGMQESKYVLVDYNRSGNPLCEVVTKPEMTSADEARDFMKQLVTILEYLNVFDVNKCTLRADANVSVKESGYTRVEIKNINGFKEIEKAILYEVERQKRDVKEGKKIVMETVAWDSDKGMTLRLRSKETEEDYGYIIDPNLVKTEISKDMIMHAKMNMPELPQEKAKRYVAEFKIDKDDAVIISNDLNVAVLFEKVASEINPVAASKWFRKELLRVLNLNKLDATHLLIDERHIIDLLKLVEEGKISDRVSQRLLERIILEPAMPSEIVKKENLEKVQDKSQLEKICEDVIKTHASLAKEFAAGKGEALNYLIGKVMRATAGKADAKEVKYMIRKLVK